MLKSMTGFARETTETEYGTLSVELRSVNHRYLDIQCRLPEDLRPHEAELRSLLGASLGRGKVECGIYLKRATNNPAETRIDTEVMQKLLAQLNEVKQQLDGTLATDPLEILRWPGMLKEPELDTGQLLEDVKQLLEAALSSLNGMRSSEGQRIADMLESRLSDIAAIATEVKARVPEVIEHMRQRILERIEKLDVAADPSRLETEIALLAQKLDVEEEIDRLNSHISETRMAFDNDEPVGRRLDFLMQEFNREANTLGSKSADAQTTRAAVDLKVLIEQMREQVQNVE